MTQITRLEATNVKRLRAVNIKPDGSLVIVAGDNAQGKTSVLDSIMYALGGGRALPEEPLRKGAKSGAVKVTLDNGLTVERTFSKKGSNLTVSQTVQGENRPKALSSPQRILDALYGRMSFDPLAFTRLSDEARLEMLRGMVPADVQELLDVLQADHDTAYDRRTEVNREVKRLKALGLGEDVEDTGIIDTAEIARKISAIDGDIQASHEAKEDWNDAEQQVKVTEEDVKQLRSRVAALESDIEVLENRRGGYEETATNKAQEFQAIDHQIPDKSPLLAKLAEAGERNAEAERAKARNVQRAQIAEHELYAARLTTKVETVKEAREDAISGAALPIEGLSFDDTGVRVSGQPWDQASGAEQLRISVAMGIALNPELKVLLVRDGSLLDANSLKLLAELAEDAGAQVWLEMVGDRDDATVVIEDGMVAPKFEEGPGGTVDRLMARTLDRPVMVDDEGNPVLGSFDENGDAYDAVPYGKGEVGPKGEAALGDQHAETNEPRALAFGEEYDIHRTEKGIDENGEPV